MALTEQESDKLRLLQLRKRKIELEGQQGAEGFVPGEIQRPEEERVSEFLTQHPNIAGLAGVAKGFGELATNIPSSTLELGQNIAQAVTSPVQTVKALGAVASGAVQKLIPGEQRNEAVFNAVVGELAQQYGSLEAASNFAIEKPAIFASDVAAILSGVGIGVKALGTAGRVSKLAELGQAAQTAGKLIDPIGGITTGVSKVAKGVKFKNSLVKTALDLPKKKGIERIDELADSFVSKGLNVNRRSLKVLDNGIRKVQKEIGNIIDTKTAEGVRIKTESIVASLDDLLESAGKEGLEATDLRVIRRMRDQFAEQHGAVLTPRQVQDIKVGFNKGFKADLSSRFGQVRGKVRNKLREASKLELENIHPELKGLNADEGVMLELNKAIQDRIIAIEKKPIIPVRGLVAGTIAGGVAGGASGDIITGLKFGVAAVLVDKVITSPRLQVSVAKALNKAQLKAAKAGKLSVVTRPAFQAGRISGAAEDEIAELEALTGVQ